MPSFVCLGRSDISKLNLVPHCLAEMLVDIYKRQYEVDLLCVQSALHLCLINLILLNALIDDVSSQQGFPV